MPHAIILNCIAGLITGEYKIIQSTIWNNTFDQIMGEHNVETDKYIELYRLPG